MCFFCSHRTLIGCLIFGVTKFFQFAPKLVRNSLKNPWKILNFSPCSRVFAPAVSPTLPDGTCRVVFAPVPTTNTNTNTTGEVVYANLMLIQEHRWSYFRPIILVVRSKRDGFVEYCNHVTVLYVLSLLYFTLVLAQCYPW